MASSMTHILILIGAFAGSVIGNLWLPWLMWYCSLPSIIRRNLPPRNRPWWIP